MYPATCTNIAHDTSLKIHLPMWVIFAVDVALIDGHIDDAHIGMRKGASSISSIASPAMHLQQAWAHCLPP
jgi:hypothetical protein